MSEINNYKNLGDVDVGGEYPVPFPAPMFVSLYLIMLTIFIFLVKDLDLSSDKHNEAFRSVKTKFGEPTEIESYSQLVKPKLGNFVTELEQILGIQAKIETAPTGERTKITLDKYYYFFPDETGFKPERVKLMEKLKAHFARWNDAEHPDFMVSISIKNYEQDKLRLANFIDMFGSAKPTLAMNDESGDKIIILIEQAGE